MCLEKAISICVKGPPTQTHTTHMAGNRSALAVFSFFVNVMLVFCSHLTSLVIIPHHQWFKCDDAWITQATTEEVLNSEGYVSNVQPFPTNFSLY